MAQSPASGSDQKAVFALLADPAIHGGTKVQRFETHGAVVFLAGTLAYKVKREVRYPFLDYSTLAKREAACRAELSANRNFAPQLYRRVVPITRRPDGGLALDGTGKPVEWAVEMSRFDENNTLDHVAERGALDDKLAAQLGDAIVKMHDRAEGVEATPWLTALEGFISSNSTAFMEHADLFAQDRVKELESKTRANLERIRPLLVARGQSGLVRRGHGDLHLANIALLDGEPVAFDALEFDPIIAAGDVLYDLAFLLMDLVERNLPRPANLVLNKYFVKSRRTADYDGIAALPFFMSLRAAIRAKVTAMRSDLAQPNERSAVRQSATRYFQLALDLLAPSRPMVVCTGGLSGTGKSVLARSLAYRLAPQPGALVFRSDVERKVLLGVAETDNLATTAYDTDTNKRIYSILVEKAARVAHAGSSVIVDAVFAESELRAAIEGQIKATGVDFRGLFLVCDLPTRIKRIGSRGPDASDANMAVARQQENFDIGKIRWMAIDASGPPEETLDRAIAAIGLL